MKKSYFSLFLLRASARHFWVWHSWGQRSHTNALADAFGTARPGGQTPSSETSCGSPSLQGLNVFCFLCCYTLESAIGGKPRATSKPSWRYFLSAETVKMGASLCRRDAAARNRNKCSTDLWMGYGSVNSRGSKLKRLQRRLFLLGTATFLLHPEVKLTHYATHTACRV